MQPPKPRFILIGLGVTVDELSKPAFRAIPKRFPKSSESVTGKKNLEELIARFPISEAAEKAKRRIAGLNAQGQAPSGAAAPSGKP